MARKTKEEANETRENILNAAVRVFDERGVNRASLEDIAEAAGVTRGAVYWHFKNKCDIFGALHDRKHASFIEILATGLDISPHAPLERLQEQAIDMLSNMQEDDINTCRIFLSRCDYSGEFAPFLDIQSERHREAFELIHQFFRRADELQSLPAHADTRRLAMGFFCLISGMFRERLMNTGLIDFPTDARPMIEAYFKNL